MSGDGGCPGRFAWWAATVLLGMGAVSVLLWGFASVTAPGAPIVELPQVAALTCVLGAFSLGATSRMGAFVRDRVRDRDPVVSWPSTVTKIGMLCATLLVLLSFVLLANGVLYFALDRAWPITPAQAGRVQFYALAALILVPAAVALLASTGIVVARIRQGTG